VRGIVETLVRGAEGQHAERGPARWPIGHAPA
jgi:hypothetical protein